MSVYKDEKKGTWFVKGRYKDWNDETRWVTKRGFATKREALTWEREFKLQKAGNLSETFETFVETYKSDVFPRLKESTVVVKEDIISSKLIPYFGKKKMCEILPSDIVKWQNELLMYRDAKTGEPYSPCYLKTIHNQISAIMNHAVRYYNLQKNPAMVAGNVGTDRYLEMKFWTKEEYLRFSEEMMENDMAYYCFELLYWCGIREGELLALTKEDFNFTTKTLSITKTIHRSKGKDITTSPKTPKSKRKVAMPDFLCEEMKDYICKLYDVKKDERIFPVTKYFLLHRLKAGIKKCKLPPIRVHDLRHSHVSLLIDMGFGAVAIAERMGHKSIDITFRYAHLFPSVQSQMTSMLEDARNGEQ